MSRYASLGHNLTARDGNDVVLTFEDIESILHRPLPASARVHRAWWSNSPEGHAQARPGWLDAGWKVDGVDFQNGTVHFHRVETRGPRIISDPAELKALRDASRIRWANPADALEKVRDVMIDFFGNREAGENLPVFSTKRVGAIPRDFDLVSNDGSKVGDLRLIDHSEGGRVPTSKLSAISELVWLLQQSQAHERFIVFGKDATVAQAWLDRYGHLAQDVIFYHVTEDRDVTELQPRPRIGGAVNA